MAEEHTLKEHAVAGLIDLSERLAKETRLLSPSAQEFIKDLIATLGESAPATTTLQTVPVQTSPEVQLAYTPTI